MFVYIGIVFVSVGIVFVSIGIMSVSLSLSIASVCISLCAFYSDFKPQIAPCPIELDAKAFFSSLATHACFSKAVSGDAKLS